MVFVGTTTIFNCERTVQKVNKSTKRRNLYGFIRSTLEIRFFQVS